MKYTTRVDIVEKKDETLQEIEQSELLLPAVIEEKKNRDLWTTLKTIRQKLTRPKPIPEEYQIPEFTSPLVRVEAPPEQGLTKEQVADRIARGAVNHAVESASKSKKEIICSNIFTYFNLIFFIIAVLLIMVGSFRDLTFLPVIIANTAIGIFQELRSKKVLDELTILNAPKNTVLRDGREEIVPAEELVLDDILILKAGSQIPADATVVSGEVLVNEALITGEADQIQKKQGDTLLSGSFVASGECRARIEKVGKDSYVSQLTLEAKAMNDTEVSEMIRSLDRLVKIVGFIILPIGIVLFSQQHFINGTSIRDSVTSTVAAVIGMIPEGLYLLASVALAVSVMRLATQKVLVHNMKCIETLARVDVLCVDKTGTITDNTMSVKKVIPFQAEEMPGVGKDTVADSEQVMAEGEYGTATEAAGAGQAIAAAEQGAMSALAENVQKTATAAVKGADGVAAEDSANGVTLTAQTGETGNRMKTSPKDSSADQLEEKYRGFAAEAETTEAGREELELALGDFAAAMATDNITMKAIKDYFRKRSGKRPEKVYSFSSATKYSGAVFEDASYVLGAPEFILRDQYAAYSERIEYWGRQGYRVLVFAKYEGVLDGEKLTAGVQPMGMILLANPIRQNAKETFAYFAEQGVKIKVISGDNPVTVSEVAKEAGIEHAEDYVDASTLTNEKALFAAAERYTVFGRVTPDQKRQLVSAMKGRGHTVAMTGDGVNDVLALKDADCSIAMASGSDAASQVAQLVLLESDFSKMPSVVAEGRRVVNNIERTASLFLVKNIFSLFLSIFSIILMVNYPLEPSQISLISMFTIGIPAFVMSLERNTDRIKGHFLSNVLFKALPGGLTDFLVVSSLYMFCMEFNVSETDVSTSCTIILAIVGLMILYQIASPMTKYHWILWFGMAAGLLYCMIFVSRIFAITSVSKQSMMLLIVFAVVTEPTFRYLSILIRKLSDWYTQYRQRQAEKARRSQNL